MIESYAMFHIPLIRNDVKDWQEKKKKLLNLVNSGKFDMKKYCRKILNSLSC